MSRLSAEIIFLKHSTLESISVHLLKTYFGVLGGAWEYLRRSEERVQCPATRVIGGCKLLTVDSGNWSLALWKNSKHSKPLNKPSPQPYSLFLKQINKKKTQAFLFIPSNATCWCSQNQLTMAILFLVLVFPLTRIYSPKDEPLLGIYPHHDYTVWHTINICWAKVSPASTSLSIKLNWYCGSQTLKYTNFRYDKDDSYFFFSLFLLVLAFWF